MATIIKPTEPGWRSVSVHYQKVRSRFSNPFTLQSQSQTYAGELWTFDLALPSMSWAQAEAWTAFLWELTRDGDNFALDTSKYVPAAAPQSMLVRLIATQADWTTDETYRFGVNFSVQQDI